jgi:hypothetical protein
MDDITKRLRQTRADMIGTDDERHYWDCHDAAYEIERLRGYRDMAEADRDVAMMAAERLRCVTEPLTKKKWAEVPLPLTDEERRVLRDLRDSYASEDDQECNQIAEVLDGLLERLK